MERSNQDDLQHISSYTGKLLRQKFGRGPEACFAAMGNGFLVLYIRGFLSTMEELLIQQGHGMLVESARQTILSVTLEELKGVIQTTTGVEVAALYQDWSYPNNTGTILAMLDADHIPVSGQASGGPDIDAVKLEVNRLSALVQKVPERTLIYRIDDWLYVAVRSGILVPIEKALIQKGFSTELLLTKDELEKTYFHRDGRFETMFGRTVADIFFDWDLRLDQGLIVFVLK